MINTVSRLNIMAKHYAGHRVQAMVKFCMIDHTKNEWLKGDKTVILIMMYHNQRFLERIFVRGR